MIKKVFNFLTTVQYRVKLIKYRTGAVEYWPQVRYPFFPFWLYLDHEWGVYNNEHAAWNRINDLILTKNNKIVIGKKNLYRNV